ncbi:diacylglycerol kinase [Stakelama tenebrarum]|uniref:Diacylglycerol kinase n=1 Tax=Stakelama tenebrarum TaxID=2711215 RepID=A0A6G6Y8J0_9SPHN|nr:diacylglycerol kinase [Sphingosinithalassobacter tenebrarum]QIG81028.1 diacylglycerol kinase [Sphingosinithalassobacter tenebrarum]
MKNRPFRERLGFALTGLATGWRRERSFRNQTGMAALALLALIVLRPAPAWWAIVAITTALVLALELLNSALEAVIDLLHPSIHPEVKAAKDMLAGAVLAISIAALLVAGAMTVDTLPRRLAELGLIGA